MIIYKLGVYLLKFYFKISIFSSISDYLEATRLRQGRHKFPGTNTITMYRSTFSTLIKDFLCPTRQKKAAHCLRIKSTIIPTYN